jgi:hypothetical protein
MDSKRTGIASWGALWEGWEALQSKMEGFLVEEWFQSLMMLLLS